MEKIIKKVVKVGNSAGVILPKEWYGGEARVELVKKPLDIEEDALKILKPYLKDVLGIYIVGSYARGEETESSDVDVIAISKDIKKEISYGKYNISIYALESVKKTLEDNPIMIYPRLLEAKTILNHVLLEELRNSVSKIKINDFIEDTKRIIKIDKEFIELDKLDGENLKSESVVYSLILRLRAVFLIKMMMNKKAYSKKMFKSWFIREIGNREEADKLYLTYEEIRDNKKTKSKIKVSTAEKLLRILENEVKKFENHKKWQKGKKGWKKE